ncbi:hypothetical protein JDV02_008561 [Purpureocillium takamizusanense]|uniref:Uncharacterized protein n=1 Tax=Purpureocillium takamizusanense TaxID=2060973 RepID=A0A9Q8VEK1_9HYPO|nr:uncharacterized protein JDV02_008561 [Purpureocillium takamizusanense]UNI22698.1 hypothetical protein JDV02_008561 [Purpureocillium takamizusanense]
MRFIKGVSDRGEGANHAIVDTQDSARLVTSFRCDDANRPHRGISCIDATSFHNCKVRKARTRIEESGRHGSDTRRVHRKQPDQAGLLAFRRACLDAHEWSRIRPASPLLCTRQMSISYDVNKNILMLE